MPEIDYAKDLPEDVELVAVPVTAEEGDAEGLAAKGLPAAVLAAQGFEGKADQLAWLPGGEDGPVTAVVGLGPAAAVDAARLRRAAAQVVRRARRVGSVALPLLDALPPETTATARAAAARAAAEGAALGAYRYTELRTDPGPSGPDRVVLVGRGGQRGDLQQHSDGVGPGRGQPLGQHLHSRHGGPPAW